MMSAGLVVRIIFSSPKFVAQDSPTTMAIDSSESQAFEPLQALPFPPLYKSHILHCSYHHWYPRLRAYTPKARLIALSAPFLDYLRSDGIVLPASPQPTTSDNDSGIFTSTSSDFSDEDDEDTDPSAEWPEIHTSVTSTIKELGGKVNPKLNWSAPKDATWMSATNDMDCRSANDVYLLLKSSDFVTHDLEHAFDGCIDQDDTEIPYHLVLRKSFQLNPALEFRCFVREKQLIALCQRDQNYFEFLFPMKDNLRDRIEAFLRDTLLPAWGNEDPNFVFDVYIPPPHDRVWLVDINPWAQRTDPLLFSWLELLTMPLPQSVTPEPVRLSLHHISDASASAQSGDSSEEARADSEESSEEEELDAGPEFRLVNRDDPEAYQFAATKYSAHKLPKDVVDASLNANGPAGMSALMEQWKKVMNGDLTGQESSDEDNDNGTV